MTPDLRFDPPYLALARTKLGVKEIAGPEAHPDIIEFHATCSLKATSDEIAWCSAFVNWSMVKSGIPGTNSAAAVSWMNWGVQCGAVLGAVGIIQWDSGKHHVTLIAGRAPDGRPVGIGGNQNNAVNYSAFLRTRFIGFRMPPLPLIDAAMLAQMQTPTMAETR